MADCEINLPDNVMGRRIARMFWKSVWNAIVNIIYFDNEKE